MRTTDDCTAVLRKLSTGKPFLLSPTDVSDQERQLWYYAARRERMRISIRETPTGVLLWIVARPKRSPHANT